MIYTSESLYSVCRVYSESERAKAQKAAKCAVSNVLPGFCFAAGLRIYFMFVFAYFA
jgi:hypothetical protein